MIPGQLSFRVLVMAIPDESLPPPGRGPRGIDLLLGAFPPRQLSEIVGPWSSGGGRLRAAFSSADLLARCPGFALVALDLGELPLVRREPIPPALCLRLKIAA